MSDTQLPFPTYGAPKSEWFRLSEIPLGEQQLFKEWLIDNYVILDAAVEEKNGVSDGFILKYYLYWKRGGTVRIVDPAALSSEGPTSKN